MELLQKAAAEEGGKSSGDKRENGGHTTGWLLVEEVRSETH